MCELAPRKDLKYTVSHRERSARSTCDTHQGLPEIGAETRLIQAKGAVQDHHGHHREGKGRRHHQSPPTRACSTNATTTATNSNMASKTSRWIVLDGT